MTIRPALAALALLAPVLSALPSVQESPREEVRPALPQRSELERAFSERMSGAVLVGHFTDDSDPDGGLQAERYTLGAVVPVEGQQDRWRFEAKIEYGERSVTVPLVLDVLWAGDTPVVTLTDYKVPLMGTFTARVLFHQDRYCGTWQGAGHGGTLFGRIERPAPDQSSGAQPGESQSGGEESAAASSPQGTDAWVASMVEQGNWPSYRGPAARGVSDAEPLPERWNVFEDEGIAYRSPLPGLAHSSPVIWGDDLYVTSSVPLDGEEPTSVLGLYGSIQAVEDEGPQDFLLLCLDRESGELRWERSLWQGQPRFPRHPKSSFAASTPATDGERVVAFFGSEGLYCTDTSGEVLWSRDLGELGAGFFMTRDQWGFAASPVLHEGKVVVQVDVLEGCFVAVLDGDTGEELWRTERDDVPTWCTPTVHVGAGRSQVLCNGYKSMAGYDLATGSELWRLSGAGDIPVPTPVVGHGNVYLTSSHGLMSVVYAVPLDASGTVERKDDQDLSWSGRPGTYMQTPLVYGDEVYLCTDQGILYCYDAVSGELHYRQRLGAGGPGYTPSLVAGDGKLYATSEEGTVHVLRAGTTFEELAVNELGEQCMATPAISGGRLHFRTRHHLIAIGTDGP